MLHHMVFTGNLCRAARAMLQLSNGELADAAGVGYRAVDPALFGDIASQKIGPAPGPQPESLAHAGREKTNAGNM